MIAASHIYLLFAVFAVVMLGFVLMLSRFSRTSSGFLVAHRNVSVWRGAFSMAVSWVWAPAIFICAMQAYNLGVPGIFWFTAPNVLCFFLFAAVAYRMRTELPEGYTLPHYVNHKFNGDKKVHAAFLTLAIGYQVFALIVNAVAGGALLHLVSGIDASVAIVGMVGVALAYSLISGLRASIITDVVQMVIILGFAGILVPWAIISGGGFDTVVAGLAGITGEHGNLFDSWLAYAMGIPMTVSLMAGPLSDQMFYQRAMAVKKDVLIPVFVRGGLIFGLVPVMLSLLGFIGVTLVNSGALTVTDPQMVGPAVIGALLPDVALYLFIIMAFAGLCSTMDSAFCGISALGTIDIYKRYVNSKADDCAVLNVSRVSMVVAAVIGLAVALLEPQLLWLFFVCGTMAGAGFVPTLLAVFSKTVSGHALFVAIVVSIICSVPLSIYANITGDAHLNVLASLSSIVVSSVVIGVYAFSAKK